MKSEMKDEFIFVDWEARLFFFYFRTFFEVGSLQHLSFTIQHYWFEHKVTTYLRAARDDSREFAIDSRRKRQKKNQETTRNLTTHSRRGYIMTTASSPHFLEHADDGTRILNKRRQLFDIKVRCSVSLVLFHSTFFASSNSTNHIFYFHIHLYHIQIGTIHCREGRVW